MHVAVGFKCSLNPGWGKLVDPPGRGNRKVDTYMDGYIDLLAAAAASLAVDGNPPAVLPEEVSYILPGDAKGEKTVFTFKPDKFSLFAEDMTTLILQKNTQLVGFRPHRGFIGVAYTLTVAGKKVPPWMWFMQGPRQPVIDMVDPSRALSGLSLERFLYTLGLGEELSITSASDLIDAPKEKVEAYFNRTSSYVMSSVDLAEKALKAALKLNILA